MRKHLFHIVPVSPWPAMAGYSALIFVSGVAFYMHNVVWGGYILLFGLLNLCFCAFF
jgi:hypothetical protein